MCPLFLCEFTENKLDIKNPHLTPLKQPLHVFRQFTVQCISYRGQSRFNFVQSQQRQPCTSGTLCAYNDQGHFLRRRWYQDAPADQVSIKQNARQRPAGVYRQFCIVKSPLCIVQGQRSMLSPLFPVTPQFQHALPDLCHAIHIERDCFFILLAERRPLQSLCPLNPFLMKLSTAFDTLKLPPEVYVQAS